MASRPLLIFSFLIFASCFCVNLSCKEDDLYLIRSHAYPGSVFDAFYEPSMLTLRFFSNSTGQLWSFQEGDQAGLFYIVNNKTGKVLDFQPNGVELNLVTKKKKKIRRQQWGLTISGRIINSQNRRHVELRAGRFGPGNPVVLSDPNNIQAQEFVWDRLQDINLEELQQRVNGVY